MSDATQGATGAEAGRTRHLLTVWNPSYTADALDAHLEVLIRWARDHETGRADEDDVYVWWGKIRSRHREGRLPHLNEILALDAQVEAGTETHLYLTDYRSLYVAHVGEVTDEDVRSAEGERAHMPDYYAEHPVDVWFRLFDIRLLVSHDTPAVIAELKRLRNTRYFERPVSLYGGIVEPPLLVWREPEAQWFSDRDALLEGRLWAEHAAAVRSDAARMATELRDNLVGRTLWAEMEVGSRTFLSAAEAVFRARRDDPGFDLSTVAVEYGKAVETELNALVFPALRRAARGWPAEDRRLRIDGRTVELDRAVPHQTLGALLHLLEKDETVARGLRQQLPHDAEWLIRQLPRLLQPLAELRNPGAHSEAVDAAALEPVREELLGIGHEGVLVKVVRARVRGR